MALSGSLVKSNSNERTDLVAYWSVPLTDGAHTVEFEHGTTSGKRVIRVDGQVRTGTLGIELIATIKSCECFHRRVN